MLWLNAVLRLTGAVERLKGAFGNVKHISLTLRVLCFLAALCILALCVQSYQRRCPLFYDCAAGIAYCTYRGSFMVLEPQWPPQFVTVHNAAHIWGWIEQVRSPTARDDIRLRVSLWAVAAVLFALAVLPWCMKRVRRRLWPPPGVCARCGYDLTGNVSGRCPECGTPIKDGASRKLGPLPTVEDADRRRAEEKDA